MRKSFLHRVINVLAAAMLSVQSIAAFGVPSATMFSNGALPSFLSGAAGGYRNNGSGAFNNVGSNGNFWVAGPNSPSNGRNLNFNSGNVNPLNNNNRANGFSVRPVQAFIHRHSFRFFYSDVQLTKARLHELLTDAYLEARKNERNKTSQLRFEIESERKINVLTDEIWNRTYVVLPPECFIITEPTVREVFAPRFRDRVVSHLLFGMLYPFFERTFVYDTYSCRLGKGTLVGIDRFEHNIRSVTDNYRYEAFILNLDISGYFMHIVKEILYDYIHSEIEKRRHDWTHRGSHERWEDIIDFDLVDFLLRAQLFRDPVKNCTILGSPSDWDPLPANKSMFNMPPGVGLTIGDVMSQLYSNIYLNPFDQYLKRELHCRYTNRYVDDGRILSRDYAFLEEVKLASAQFLKERLQLTLHPNKTTITSTRDTNGFLGAAIKPFRRYADNKTVARFHRFVAGCEMGMARWPDVDFNGWHSTFNSYLGYFSHFNEWKMLDRTLRASPVRYVFDFNQEYTKATFKPLFV